MIRVSVPATSANVCIGFDSLGLALDWWAHFRFEKNDSLTITGCPEKFCNRDNLVIKGFEAVCQKLGRELPSFHLDIDTDIPFSRGLGSSATCIVAGILAADAWFDAHLTKSEMLNSAASLEGHADNVAAALYGHLVVTYKQNDVWKLTLIPCATWNMLALIPDYPVSTEEARTLIPDKVLLEQASLQTAHAIAFCSALIVVGVRGSNHQARDEHSHGFVLIDKPYIVFDVESRFGFHKRLRLYLLIIFVI